MMFHGVDHFAPQPLDGQRLRTEQRVAQPQLAEQLAGRIERLGDAICIEKHGVAAL